MRQFISCSSDNYIFVWDMRRPPSDDDMGQYDDDDERKEQTAASTKGKNWARLKAQSAISVSYGNDKKWSPAIGKYKFLNKIWKPVHKICFLDPKPLITIQQPHMSSSSAREDPLLKVLITSLSVTARPDLMVSNRKQASLKASLKAKALKATALDALAQRAPTDRRPSSVGSVDGDDRSSVQSGSIGARRTQGSVSSENEDEDAPPDPTQMALPTMLMAGTIWGAIFRADLSKNKVDVETNNLREFFSTFR